MHRINKIDYFVGVFLTTILNSSEGAPALFDGTENSKRVEFSTDSSGYNVYVKYSTKVRKTKVNLNGKRKTKMSWDIQFSQNDYSFIKDRFKKEDKENLICLVCTNEGLNQTYMAVLKYEDALKCLEKSTSNGYRRITVARIGREHDFYCYGVGGFREDELIKCPVDCTKFLGGI